MEQQQNKYISALDIGTSKVIALIGEIGKITKSTLLAWVKALHAVCVQVW